MFVEFPKPVPSADDLFSRGDPVSIDPTQVAAMEPHEHRYHSFRSPQEMTDIHLKSGQTVRVFAMVSQVRAKIDAALAEGKD